jgi:hypothetical protein
MSYRVFVPGHSGPKQTIANPQSRPCDIDFARIHADIAAGRLRGRDLLDPKVAARYRGATGANAQVKPEVQK